SSVMEGQSEDPIAAGRCSWVVASSFDVLESGARVDLGIDTHVRRPDLEIARGEGERASAGAERGTRHAVWQAPRDRQLAPSRERGIVEIAAPRGAFRRIVARHEACLLPEISVWIVGGDTHGEEAAPVQLAEVDLMDI